MVDYQFPKALQAKLEADIVSGKLQTGAIVGFDDLQKQYQTDPENLTRVIQSGIRKGLLKPLAATRTYTILGKSRPTIISVFQHAAKTGLAPKSIVRAVIAEPARAVIMMAVRSGPNSMISERETREPTAPDAPNLSKEW